MSDDWFTISNSNGTDFTITYSNYTTSTNFNIKKDPLEEMGEEFDRIKARFFEERIDELKEPDLGLTPYGLSRTSRKGRELSFLDNLRKS